jgi:hypothetical protein
MINQINDAWVAIVGERCHIIYLRVRVRVVRVRVRVMVSD